MFLFLFCQDLDSFLTWLVQTQTAAASDQLPNDLEEAEKLINKHAALKEEIGRCVLPQDYSSLCPKLHPKKKNPMFFVCTLVCAVMKKTTSACRP